LSNAVLKKIRTASRMPRRDLFVVLEAWLILLYVHAILTALPYPWWRRLLVNAREAATHESEHTPGQSERRLLRLFRIAVRNHLWQMNCLRRSLALRLLLARRGVEAGLVLGVRKEGAAIEGHAWLQINGTVINDRADIARQFTPLQDASEAASTVRVIGRR